MNFSDRMRRRICQGVGFSKLVFEYKDDFEWIRVVDMFPKEHRYLQFEDSVQGVMDLAEVAQPVLEYVNLMAYGVRGMIKEPHRILLGGLGPGSLLQAFSSWWPDTHILTFESNHRVLEVARNFFDLPTDRKVVVGDLRDCLERKRINNADLIAVDCYSATTVPHQLTTLEFMYLLASKLADDGVVVFNLWSPGCNRICADQMKTILAVFREVALVHCFDDENLILYARKEGHWQTWPKTLTVGGRQYPMLSISQKDKASWPEFLFEGRIIEDNNVYEIFESVGIFF